MRTYWDTSALVVALHNEAVRQQLDTGEHVTRPHALAELFSVLTGGRLGFKYRPQSAAALVADLIPQLEFEELDAPETWQALSEAHRYGVVGGKVHDWMHAYAAEKTGAEVLLTLNLSHFADFQRGWRLESPTA